MTNSINTTINLKELHEELLYRNQAAHKLYRSHKESLIERLEKLDFSEMPQHRIDAVKDAEIKFNFYARMTHKVQNIIENTPDAEDRLINVYEMMTGEKDYINKNLMSTNISTSASHNDHVKMEAHKEIYRNLLQMLGCKDEFEEHFSF